MASRFLFSCRRVCVSSPVFFLFRSLSVRLSARVSVFLFSVFPLCLLLIVSLCADAEFIAHGACYRVFVFWLLCFLYVEYKKLFTHSCFCSLCSCLLLSCANTSGPMLGALDMVGWMLETDTQIWEDGPRTHQR
jgi:hypothetical protein